MIHIGYADRNKVLEEALDICTTGDTAMEVGIKEGMHTAEEFTEYLIQTIREIKQR